jgi:hypothetical protein
MERIVLFICGLWFWLTRRSRTSQYEQAVEFLNSARVYLITDYHNRASTRSRGGLLPDQHEALRILEQQRTVAAQTGSRFQSLSECVRMVSEELNEPSQAA